MTPSLDKSTQIPTKIASGPVDCSGTAVLAWM
jgi:hypothetical protein